MLQPLPAETILNAQRGQTGPLSAIYEYYHQRIFRYLYLIYQKWEGGSPERIILSDRPLLASVLLWVVLCVLILKGVL